MHVVERRRDADRLDRDVDAEAVGHRHDLLHPVGVAAVDGVGRAEGRGLVEPVGVEVEGDHPRGAVQAGGHDRGQPDRAGADDGDHVAGLDPAVADADLEAGRQDVGEHHGRLVADALGHLVQRVVGERDAHELGLGAVDQVAEDPADPGGALVGQAVRVQPLVAVGAGAAGADAGDDHPVADRDVASPPSRPRRRCRRPRGRGSRPSVTAGTSPLRMCRSVPQIVVVSTRTMTSVGCGSRVRERLPRLLAGTVVDECLHDVASSRNSNCSTARQPVAAGSDAGGGAL